MDRLFGNFSDSLRKQCSSTIYFGGQMSLESLEGQERFFQGDVVRIRKVSKDRFAVVNVPEKGEVTFSISKRVWNGDSDPMTGETVVLSKLILVHEKWRAYTAARIKP
jgi:hypothetical protein